MRLVTHAAGMVDVRALLSASDDDQLRKCREYADTHDLNVVSVESDAATTGASTRRPGLQRLLAAVRQQRPPFRALIVDDLSRLSRDLGDTWTVVFRDCAAAGVRVIGVADGVDSFDPNARLNVGMCGLINDAYLQNVSRETKRGLEARAAAGFHTGGRCYGYRTEPEDKTKDDPRYIVRIDETEARIVRRIFREYLAGGGVGSPPR